MSNWENKIIDAFINNYYASAPEAGEHRHALRLRSSVFFPDFDTAHPNEKESYLEAAESLERKGVIKLNWEKWGKGEQLKTLSCENFEKLFEEAGKLFPKTEAEKIKALLESKVLSLKQSTANPEKEKIITLLQFLSLHFSPRDIGQGINLQNMEDFIRLLEFCSEPSQPENLTSRSISILLFRDSKHLEKLLALFNPLLSRAERNISMPNLSFLERSYPETMISGKIVIEYKNEKTALINAGGHILGFPLESAEEIESIKLIDTENEKNVKTLLTIENKETFYALGNPQKHSKSKELSRFDCFLYVGGYSNRAAAALIKALAASGFSFYHAGDLDPDGILILQHIQDLAGKQVTPLRMDAATFDEYRPWSRPLSKPALRQIDKIREKIKAVPELAGLLKRIEETGQGVEQEIVDYR